MIDTDVETYAVHKAAGRVAADGWLGIAAKMIQDDWDRRENETEEQE